LEYIAYIAIIITWKFAKPTLDKDPIMNKNLRIIAAGAAFTAVGISTSAHAVLISSESFWTVNAAPTNGEYRQGSIANPNISGYNNTTVVAGNTGFNSTNVWQNNTSGVQSTTGVNLTHNGLVGGSLDGSVRLSPFASATNRNSNRALAATPTTSSSYFMSGLIRGTTPPADGQAATAGFMPSVAANTFNISTGFHMGLHVDSGSLKIAAFAGNQTFNLLTIEGPTLTATYQVVLRLDVNASGNETLTAWYAANGDTDLTLATNVNQIDIGNIWSSAADLGTFALQLRGGGASSTQIGTFDEMRFGTTMGSVTAIPEPSTLVLMVSCLTALVIFRRRRSGQAG